jgi:biopolymer transport protein ExbD
MHSRSGKKSARIEIIPLIDIIFFLLATFIMVSLSMSKNQGIKVALPAASTATSLGSNQEMEKAVTLSVNDKGELFFNKEKVSGAQLGQKLQTYKALAKDPKVIVNGEKGSEWENVVILFDAARKAGIAKVGINTDKQ